MPISRAIAFRPSTAWRWPSCSSATIPPSSAARGSACGLPIRPSRGSESALPARRRRLGRRTAVPDCGPPGRNMTMRDLPPLHTLPAFEAAARLGSFLAAAEALHLTPSAISHRIRLLEEHLGQPLFERRHRAVVLTASGRRYL